MSRTMLSSQWQLPAAHPWCSHHLRLYLQISVWTCPLEDASHLLWLGGRSLVWLQSLAQSLAWAVSMCEAAQDLLPELCSLLDGAWLGGHLGDFTSWDLHLCACWEARMGHKLIAHEYWKSPLTWATWAAFPVLGRKYCSCTWSEVRLGSIPQTMGCSQAEGQKCSVLRRLMQFWVQIQCMTLNACRNIKVMHFVCRAKRGWMYFPRVNVCAIGFQFHFSHRPGFW